MLPLLKRKTMFPKINPTETNAWHQLQQHHAEMKDASVKKMFGEDPNRFSMFSASMDDITFDYSKNIITEKTMQLLLQLAEECKVKDAIEAMFNGDKINETENRSVLHVALRNFSKEPVENKFCYILSQPSLQDINQYSKLKFYLFNPYFLYLLSFFLSHHLNTD